MKKKWIRRAGLFMASTAILFTMANAKRSKLEQPEYKVLSLVSAGDKIEIREYEPVIIAEVEVLGSRKEAIGKGFRLLADYIFGNNAVEQKIAMTAPVQINRKAAIADEAPPLSIQSADDSSWKVHFVMPSQYSLATLPKPNNEKVVLKEIPSKKYIAIEFSGRISEKNILKYQEKLMQYIAENKLKTISTASYAFYNPPWTLPFLRRNEVIIQIEF